MKKITSVCLVVALCASLAACAGGAPAASVAPSATQSSASGGQPASSAPQPAPQAPSPVTIAQTALLDSNGVKITATGFDSDGFAGAEMKLLLENSSEKNITVQTKNLVVNGYMTESIFSSNLTAGKKANETLSFLASSLKECGIETITDISLQFVLLDSDSFNPLFESDPVSLETSAKATHTQQYDASGTVLLEQDGLKVVYKALDDASFMGPRIVLYLENNSQTPLTVQQRDLSVNGFMVMGTCSQPLLPGTHAVTGITLLQSDLDANSITALQTAEFRIVASHAESWASVLESEPVTITF